MLSLTAVNSDAASIVPMSVFPVRMRLDSLDPVSFNSLKKKKYPKVTEDVHLKAEHSHAYHFCAMVVTSGGH